MAIVFAILGILCIEYGITVMAIWSGTGFFAVWHALGAALRPRRSRVRTGNL